MELGLDRRNAFRPKKEWGLVAAEIPAAMDGVGVSLRGGGEKLEKGGLNVWEHFSTRRLLLYSKSQLGGPMKTFHNSLRRWPIQLRPNNYSVTWYLINQSRQNISHKMSNKKKKKHMWTLFRIKWRDVVVNLALINEASCPHNHENAIFSVDNQLFGRLVSNLCFAGFVFRR